MRAVISPPSRCGAKLFNFAAIESWTRVYRQCLHDGEIVPLDITPGTDNHFGLYRRVPIGPILGITPFNFPLNLVAHKVAPALAVGNPIVLKPAPQTPLTSLMLGDVILQTGLPAGMVNILPCTNAVAERMVTDERFKMLSFTGSAAVGWMLKNKAGKKRVVLELGGNAGVIVEPDADLDHAADRCAVGGYVYSGQTCISVQRIYAHESVYQKFLDKLLQRVAALKAGNPAEDTTVIGPLIDEGAAERVESWIREAAAAGSQPSMPCCPAPARSEPRETRVDRAEGRWRFSGWLAVACARSSIWTPWVSGPSC